MSKPISFDWESPYGKSFSVVDLGYWKYARDERCVPYLISVCDGTESWAGEVKDFNFESIRGRRLLSHNKAFDEELALGGNERGLFDFPGLKTHGNNHWLCTLDMSAYLWNVRSLADACRIGLGITVDKSVRDRAKDKTVDDMKREGWWPDMIKYGQLDASRCWALFDKHGDKWPEFERRLSCLTIDQGRHGVRIDVRALDEGILTMQRVIAAAELNLPWVKRGRAPASPIGLAEECRNVGIPMAPVKTHDPEGAQQWEDTYSTKHKFVFALKNLRKAKKTLATLETIKLRLRPDETVAFSLKYSGAHCVDGETELLTETGWVKIRDWRGGRIAQWSSKTKDITFDAATANEFCVDEAMVKLDAPYAQGLFTFGHNIPRYTHGVFEFSPLQAGEIMHRGSVYLPTSGYLKSTGAISPLQMRLLVAVQADGHWPLNKSQGLIFTFRKERKITRLERLLGELQIPYRKQEFPSTPGQWRISVARRDIPGWLSRDRKVFGPWLLDSTPEAREAFIREIQHWDGHKEPEETHATNVEYYSSVPQNIEWVATLAHLTGRGMKSGKRGGNVRERDRTMVFRKHWTVVPSVGRVYCPSTKTGYWLYRKNGVVGVTGNTLRWAGDSGWNLQNQNKEPLFIDADYSFIFDKAAREANVKEFDKHHVGHSSFGQLESKTTFFDLRGLIIAREGMMLCPVDEAQIEPRVLNWLAGNWPLLEKIRAGLAIYEAHARETMPEANDYATPLKDTSKKIYALAKARVLGLGFKCGWEKFIVVAQTMAGIDITEGDMDFALAAAVDGKVYRRRKALNGRDWDYETEVEFSRGSDGWLFGPLKDQGANTNPWEEIVFVSQQRKRRNETQEFIGPLGVYGMRSRVTVEEFRRTNPLIVALWKALDDELRKCGDEGRDLVVTGPHGGSLTYRNVRAEKRKAVDRETGAEYERRVYTAEIGGKRYVLHGGVLCENLVQFVARMVFAERMLDLHDRLQLEDPSQRVLFSVHDEAVPEIKDPGTPAAREAKKKEIEAIMAITPSWLDGCPLGAEAKLTKTYCK